MGGRGLTARWVAAEFGREQEGAGVEPPQSKRLRRWVMTRMEIGELWAVEVHNISGLTVAGLGIINSRTKIPA